MFGLGNPRALPEVPREAVTPTAAVSLSLNLHDYRDPPGTRGNSFGLC
jgi:hypothetical protein